MKIYQKPIDTDAQFKYRCPQCGWEHWLSIKQAKTKNYKIVCDCDAIFRPKRIKNITISYASPKRKQASVSSSSNEIEKPKNISESVITEPVKPPIQPEILDKCSRSLVAYGFTIKEAKELVIKAYEIIGICDTSLLLKKALEILGENK